MVRRVLLSTDFSKNAQHAIDYALLLFGEEHVHYYLLNSYGIVNNLPETLISLEDILHEQSEKGLRQSREQIVGSHQQLEIETISAYGEPPVAIGKVAKDHSIDIVVLGSGGSKAVSETLFGSTIANLVKKITQPMLIVPLQFPINPPNKIVFATDLSQVEDLKLLEPMLILAHMHDAEVIIINVTEEDRDQKVKRALSRLDFNKHFEGIKYRFEVVHDEDILNGISEFASQQNADLLVLSPKQYPYFKRLFHRSVTKQMIRRSDIPILVI